MTSTFEDKNDIVKLEQIHTKYRGLMHHAARGILKDESLADEAVSESFMKLYKNISKIDDVFCPRTYGLIVTIVERTAIDIYRREKTHRQNVGYDEIEKTPSSSPTMDELVIGAETIDMTVELVDSVDDKYREVLKLSLFNKFTNKEIAEILDLPYETVKKRVQRARNEIKKKLIEKGVCGARR